MKSLSKTGKNNLRISGINNVRIYKKYIDFEEMKAVAYITLSVILAIIISLQVEKYYESLFQAYQKEINGEVLTKKEKKKAEKYKNNIESFDNKH